MTQSLAVHRRGDLIVLEDREQTPDHAGVLSTILLSLDDAAWLRDQLHWLIISPEGER
jgi:hypothetical protein